MSTEKDKKSSEEIKPFTERTVNQKPQKPKGQGGNKLGIILLASSVVAGTLVLGGSWYVAQRGEEAMNNGYAPKTEQTSTIESEETESSVVIDETNPNLELVDVTTFKTIPDKVIDWTKEPFSDGYKQDDSQLEYVNGDMLEELNKEGKYLVYVGRPNCPYCHVYRQNQDKVLKNLDMKIYSIDSIYAKVDEKLNKIINEQWGLEGVPTVYVIEDGKVVKEIYDDVDPDNFEELYDADFLTQWFNDNK